MLLVAATFLNVILLCDFVPWAKAKVDPKRVKKALDIHLW